MALSAEALQRHSEESATAPARMATIIEFPTPLTPQQLSEIAQENTVFIQHLSLEQDSYTIEKAQRDRALNPRKRLVDLYSRPPKNSGHLSATIEPRKD